MDGVSYNKKSILEKLDSTPTVDSKNAVTSEGIKDYVDKSYTIAGRKEGSTLGVYATAEGYNTIASNFDTHAEGCETSAHGTDSHAEGYGTTAQGMGSHAEGFETVTNGDYSHAEGHGTCASHAYQHVFGEYNVPDNSSEFPDVRGNYVEIVGNGTSDSSKSNARTLDWQGNEYVKGNITIGGTPSGSNDVATLGMLNQKAADLRTEFSANLTFKGSCTYSNLPSSHNVNDTWYVTDRNYLMTWNGTEWCQSSMDTASYDQMIEDLRKTLTAEYSSRAYNVGELCVHIDTDGHYYLWACNTKISSAETWNSSHWTKITFADAIDDIIEVSNTQPTSPANKIWLNTEEASIPIQIPTMEDIDDIISSEYDMHSSYKVGDYAIYEDDMYRCTVEINDPGETWNSSHWTKVNVGSEITNVNNSLESYNAVDLLANVTRKNRTTGGVTFTWNENGSCTIFGTNTVTVICNMYMSHSVPAWIEFNRDYYVKFASNDDKVTLRIYDYSESDTLTELYKISKDTVINIPAATEGLVIRFTVEAGTHNITVDPAILTGFSNYQLTTVLTDVSDTARDNTTDISNIGYADHLREYVITDRVDHGIRFTVNDDGSVSAIGTAETNSHLHLYLDATALPEWVELEKRYYARVKTTDPSLYFLVMYHDMSQWRILAQLTDDSSFVVPSDAVGLRLSIMVNSGNTVDGTMSVAITNVDTLENIQNSISISTSNVPPYFEDVLPGKLQAITNNIATAGRNGFSMIHITDTHVTKNSHNSEILISDILKNSRVKYLLHNGDSVGTYTDSQQSCMDELREHISGFELHGKRMFVNMGNHDYNYVNNNVSHPERIITQDQIYASIMADMQGVAYYQPDKYHWYYIDVASSTALIGFQTGYNYSSFGVLAEDMPPLTALLDSLVVDNIIFSAHQVFSQDSETGLYTNLNNNNYSQIRAAIDASANASKVKCIITGHNHYDYSVVDNGILIVSTTTDSLLGDHHGTPSTKGTTDELAFDVCTFDWSNNKLYMTRIGRGSDREIALV